MAESKVGKALRLRKEEEEFKDLPIGGKSAKMGEPFYGGNKKSAEKAYDMIKRQKELESELAEEGAGMQHLRGKKSPSRSPDDIPPRNLQEAKDEMIRRKEEKAPTTKTEMGKMFKKGGKVGSASKRADGCAVRGKTRGRMI